MQSNGNRDLDSRLRGTSGVPFSVFLFESLLALDSAGLKFSHRFRFVLPVLVGLCLSPAVCHDEGPGAWPGPFVFGVFRLTLRAVSALPWRPAPSECPVVRFLVWLSPARLGLSRSGPVPW